jgi:hypothetical protein
MSTHGYVGRVDVFDVFDVLRWIPDPPPESRADGTSRVSITADAINREERARRERVKAEGSDDDVVRHPRPPVKPRRDAQWDEAAGHWMAWDRQLQLWVSLDDGSTHAPGTPSVAPHDPAVTPRVRPDPTQPRSSSSTS